MYYKEYEEVESGSKADLIDFEKEKSGSDKMMD
jgi:hypothetical protein